MGSNPNFVIALTYTSMLSQLSLMHLRLRGLNQERSKDRNRL